MHEIGGKFFNNNVRVSIIFMIRIKITRFIIGLVKWLVNPFGGKVVVVDLQSVHQD